MTPMSTTPFPSDLTHLAPQDKSKYRVNILSQGLFLREKQIVPVNTVIKNDLAVHIGIEYIYVIRGVW